MKRSVLFLVSLLVVAIMVAAPVSQQRAMQVAQQFIPVPDNQTRAPGMRAEEQPANIVYTHPMPKSGRPAFYVVNVGGSFVIVSADDVAHQVLGYNLGKSWLVAANGEVQLPPQVKGFFDDLAAQMEAAIEADSNHVADADWTQPQSAAPRRRMMSEIPDSVGPLLTTTWDQGQYYNALCPEDQSGPGGHVWAGCIATAMAQIINYWGQQMPIKTRGIHSYNSNYGTLTVNYDSAHYDFVHMPSALTSTNTQLEIDAVAKLMYDCGVATNMSYSSTESGSYDIDARTALVNHFRFSPNTSEIVKSLFSDAEWHEILRGNLAAHHPILYSGQGSGGHSFVCDGYKTDGFYHFNFGWGGFSDGWYLISVITPDGQRDYSNNQSAVVEIVPDSTSNVVFSQMTQGTSTFTISEPLEFYHSPSYNKYPIPSYNNPCNGIVYFISADTTKQLVADIISYEDQTVMIYDGIAGNQLAALYAGGENSLSPAVSTSKSLRIEYQGNMFTSGYHLFISQDDGCRMVSNIVASVDTTTVHLTWTENGNASQWEIEYGLTGFEHGEGTIISVNQTMVDIVGLFPLANYDVYIKPICGEVWSGPTSFMSDASLWSDAVNEQPIGYLVIRDTVYISTPEGLAWWAKLANMNSEPWQDMNPEINQTVVLLDDIDLYGKKWEPVKNYRGSIDGKGHIIKNMRVCVPNGRAGFINNYNLGTLCNLGFEDFFVKGYQIVSAIVCQFSSAVMKNCYARNGRIEGMEIGVLIYNPINSEIINCHSEDVYWMGAGTNGGIAGSSEMSTIRNCYSFSSGNVCSHCFNGGIVGSSHEDIIEYCYAAKLTNSNQSVPSDIIAINMNSVVHNVSLVDELYNDKIMLQESVFFDSLSTAELLTALNYFLLYSGDTTLRNWIMDNDSVYPVFGDFYSNQCTNTGCLVAKNVDVNQEPTLKLSWCSEANSFVVKCIPLTNIDTILYYYTDDTVLYINNLMLGETYYFFVKAICDENNTSGWGCHLKHTFDKIYWNEVVTSPPDGYEVDNDGNIWISSAEGLAWFISNTQNLSNITIHLTNDVDIGKYKWPQVIVLNDYSMEGYIRTTGISNCVFDGHNNTIKNLYARENYGVSFLGNIINAEIKNVKISGEVYAIDGASGLFGWTNNSIIDNCISFVNVHTSKGSAGALGESVRLSIVRNCFASGRVIGNSMSGGLLSQSDASTIINCYSTGEVICDSQSSYSIIHLGGLVGYTTSSLIMNSYSTGHVEYVPKAISLGSLVGYADSSIVNSYVLQDSNGLRIFGSFSRKNYPLKRYHDNTTFDEFGILLPIIDFNGEQDTITVNGAVYTTLLSALNAWIDANDVDGQYRHWVADTTGINGGFPIFAPMPKYVITFLNSDSSLLQRDTLEYGSMPVYRGEYPVKPATAQYTYIFKAWSPVITSVTEDATYTATFDSIVNTYVVMFLNDDSTLLQIDSLEYGAMPEYRGATPTKPATAQYTYTFTGWNVPVESVIGNATYIATFTSSVNKYIVTFVDEDGVTILQRDTLEYGFVPAYRGLTPYRENTEAYTYSFVGWSPSIIPVIGDVIYTAVYSEALRKYVIIFLDEDSTLLQRDTLDYGITPYYNGIIPQEKYTVDGLYRFIGWNQEIVSVNGDATYIAVYMLIPLVGIDTYEYPTLGECGEYSLASKWLYSNTLDNFRGNEPGGENYVRGMAVNDGKMYFVDREHAQLTIVDGSTGKMLEPLPIVGENLFQERVDLIDSYYYRTCVALPFNDIQFDSAGHCLISSGSTSSPSYNRAMVYVVDLETGLATELISERINDNPAYAEDSWRMDAISVYGDVTDHAVIMFGNSMNADLHAAYKWEINNGVAGPAERIDLIVSPDDDSYLWRSDSTLSTENISACRVHIVDDNHFYWDHHSCFPTLFSMDGTLAGDLKSCPTGMRIPMDNDTITMNYGHNGVCEFRIGEENFLIMAATNNLVRPASSYAIFKFTDQSKSFSSLVPMWFLPKDGMGIATNGPRVAVPSVEVHDTVATIYLYTQNNGYGVYEMVSRPKCTIVTHADSLQGQIVGGGTYLKNTEVHLVAVPKEGYNFVQWSDGCTDVERTIVLSQDTSISALFEIQRFTIVFRDEDSTLLQVDTLEYGTWPEYRGTSPIKASTAQYTYTFAGWSPVIASVTGNAVYEARYTATVNKYIIMFLNEDSTLLQIDTLAYGAMPEFHGATPTKQATAQYTYTFNGWNNAIVSVTGDVTYLATYVSTTNKYLIIFQDEDGTPLQQDSVEYGALPAYRGTTPTKQSTAEYTYTFAGWNPSVASVIGDATYTATYNSVVNTYTIMFLNEDSTLLQIDTLNYGAMPEYRGITPTKQATAQYTYRFNGWNNAIVSVTGDVTYLATYVSTTNKYLIIFQDEDGTPLQQDSVEYGALPAYRGNTPTKQSTAEYTYTFAGWNPSIASVIGDATYTATYYSVVNKYVVMFLNEDSTLLQIDTLQYGAMPEFRGMTPTKQATAQYTYTFAGWNNAIVSVTGNATYLATYVSTTNKYLIIFQDEDGTPLQQDSVEYGALPAYRGNTPTKQSTAEYTYTFAGWNPSIASVIGDATYTATYYSVVNKYVITFQNEDGTILQRDTLDYGVIPVYREANPTKESTAETTFTFVGWAPSISAVAEDAVYTATYDSVVNTYVVMFLNEDSTLLQIDTLEYGAMPEYRGENPVKPNEGDYFYVFTGWEPEVVPVVGDAIYVATYESHGTGLDNVAEKQKPIKVMEDGHLYILLPNGTRYDATGRKVE